MYSAGRLRNVSKNVEMHGILVVNKNRNDMFDFKGLML